MHKTLLSAVVAALACHMRGPMELLYGAHLKAAAILKTTAGADQFAGRTALDSGTAFATVSTGIVNSDSIINHNFQVTTTCGSGIGYLIGVSSIVSGVSFALGYIDGQGRAPGGTLMWEIRRTS